MSKSMRFVSLEPGQVAVLSIDGTLVYVEDVTATSASVVALPDQPPRPNGVFTPGRVGAKRISPYSRAERIVPVTELSQRNRDFIGNYETLRTKHGNNYVDRTPEELAAMTVTKKSGRKPRYKQRCATCGQQPGHPDHGTTDGKHEFVAPAAETAPAERKSTRRASRFSDAVYTLKAGDVEKLLAKARQQPRGDKYNHGNRSHRVVIALQGLANQSGTLDEVTRALVQDGEKPPANPQKVVRRTLHQLMKAEFGSIVTRSTSSSTDDADGDDE